jgi:hypothetical protein
MSDTFCARVMPQEFAGSVTITWPQPRSGSLHGWAITITDTVTGKPVSTVSGITVHLHADAGGIAWAELDMFADEDGKPILDSADPRRHNLAMRDGEIITGAFPFLVSEMRVAEQ